MLWHGLCRRPEAHNALSPGVIDSVVYLLQELKEQQDLRALFVRSAGPTFCAGGDLKHFRSTAQFSKEENVKDALRLSEVFDQLYNFPRCVAVPARDVGQAGVAAAAAPPLHGERVAVALQADGAAGWLLARLLVATFAPVLLAWSQ